jgi:hypothetical protein
MIRRRLKTPQTASGVVNIQGEDITNTRNEDITRPATPPPQPGLARKVLALQQDAGGGCQPNSLSRKKFANSARIDAKGLEPRAIRGGDVVKLHKFDLRWRDERVRQPLGH